MTENTIVEGKRLGLQDPPHDPMLLALGKYTLLSALPTGPAATDLTSRCSNPFGTMLNTQIGDCTAADAGHSVQVWTAWGSGTEVTVPDSDVLAFYELFGYVPGKPTTDNGAAIATVNVKLRKVGIGGHTIGGYGAIEPSDTELANRALWVFGGLHVGWAMPTAAQGMGEIWTVPENADGPTWEPGSWGGHDTLVAGYRTNGDWIAISWGEIVIITAAFRQWYLQEVWARVSEDWLAEHGTDPDGGFNQAQLDHDVDELATAVGTPPSGDTSTGVAAEVTDQPEPVPVGEDASVSEVERRWGGGDLRGQDAQDALATGGVPFEGGRPKGLP